MDYLLQQASVHGLGEGGVGDDGGLLLDDPDVLRGDGGRQGDQEEDQHLDVRTVRTLGGDWSAAGQLSHLYQEWSLAGQGYLYPDSHCCVINNPII